MTREEILAMKPGTDLDRMVAEEVMGYGVFDDDVLGLVERIIDPRDGGSIWCPLQPYSSDMSIAEMVIDRMIQSGHDEARYWADFGGGAYAKAEAICKAALLAVMERRRKEKRTDDFLREALGDD